MALNKIVRRWHALVMSRRPFFIDFDQIIETLIYLFTNMSQQCELKIKISASNSVSTDIDPRPFFRVIHFLFLV